MRFLVINFGGESWGSIDITSLPRGGDMIKFLRTIFLNDGFVRAIPVITLIFGVGMFACSYIFLPKDNFPAWHDASKTLSQAILVGGLVGVITNSLRYIGIFRESVHEVMFGTEHLKVRNDLPELWSKVTSVICQEKFPQLAERLQVDVLDNYVPAKKDFYYSNYSRECTIRVEGDDSDVVTLFEELDFILHPADPNKEINYIYRSKCDSRSPAALVRLNLHRLDVDGTVQQVGMVEEEYDDEFGGKGLSQSYAIPLSGKDSYRIRRSTSRNLCLTKDPVIEYSSDEFILGCVAKFRSEEPTLVPVFQSVGTEDFDDRSMGPAGNWPVHREFAGLMFPRQGYVLFIQRQVSSPPLTPTETAATS